MAFLSLSDEGRESYAALHQEIIARVSANGATDLGYGQRLVGVLAPLVRTALWASKPPQPSAGGEPVQVVAASIPHLVLGDSHRQSSIYWISGAGEDAAQGYWFIPIVPLTIWINGLRKPPPDSMWAVPWLYLRKNYRSDPDAADSHYTTNSHGYRGAEFAIPKPPDTLRILCIGGSTTEEGSRNEHTYPALLEARLRGRFPEQRIEVVNAGVSGVTTVGHLFKMTDYLALEPDLILAYVGINDLTGEALPAYRVEQAPLWTHALRHLYSMRHWRPIDFSPTADQLEPLLRDTLVTNLRALVRCAHAHGVPLAICTVALPDPKALSEDEFEYIDYHTRWQWRDPYMGLTRYLEYMALVNRLIEEVAAAEGVPLIPVAKHLTGGSEIFGDMCHMMDPGIALKAEIIYRCLVGRDSNEAPRSSESESGL